MKLHFKNAVIIVSLLLIVLFLFTKTPARAAASNPIFATIQYVQNAISTALSPVQSSLQGLSTRVTNLEATVTPIPGQITNLETAQGSQASQITNLTNRVSALENTPTSIPSRMLCNGVQEARRQERETCATFPHDLREPSDATGFQQTSPEKTLLSEKSSLASLALPQKNTSARTTHSGWLLFTQE